MKTFNNNFLSILTFIIFIIIGCGSPDKQDSIFVGKWMSLSDEIEIFKDNTFIWINRRVDGRWIVLDSERIKLTGKSGEFWLASFNDDIFPENFLVITENSLKNVFSKVKSFKLTASFDINNVISGKWRNVSS